MGPDEDFLESSYSGTKMIKLPRWNVERKYPK